MAYVEFLRIRKAFLIYAGVIATLIAFLLLSLFASHGGSGHDTFRLELGSAVVLQKGADGRIHQVPLGGMPGIAVPLGALLGIAGYCAMVFATIVSTSLNRERETLDFPFTRPVPRQRIALSYFAVDLAGIVAAFLFALAVMCLTPLAVAGVLGRIVVDPQAWWIGVLGLGISFMWYGIIQAVTAPYRGGGGWIAGSSWAVFGLLLLLPGATFLGPIVHLAVMTLNLVNPLAYFTSLTGTTHDVSAGSIFGLGIAARAGVVWVIGLAACALAALSWKRLEV